MSFKVGKVGFLSGIYCVLAILIYLICMLIYSGVRFGSYIYFDPATCLPKARYGSWLSLIVCNMLMEMACH